MKDIEQLGIQSRESQEINERIATNLQSGLNAFSKENNKLRKQFDSVNWDLVRRSEEIGNEFK